LHLDKKDTTILQELEKDSRQNFSNIARKIRLSKQSTGYRIKSLVEKGIISHFVTIVDTKKLGYTFYDVLFQFNRVSRQKETEVLEFMRSLPEVCWLVSCVGKWNALAAILVRDVNEFHDCVQRILDRFKDSIAERNFFIVVDGYPCVKKYLFDEVPIKNSFIFGERKHLDLSTTDRRILQTLKNDTRVTNMEIGRKIGARHETVKRHIAAMQNSGIIQAFSIKLNPRPYGFSWYIVLMHTDPMSESERRSFLNYLKNEKNAVFLITASGSCDFVVDLHVLGQLELDDVINGWKEKFPGIKSYEPILVTKEHKCTFIPDSLGVEHGKTTGTDIVHKLQGRNVDKNDHSEGDQILVH